MVTISTGTQKTTRLVKTCPPVATLALHAAVVLPMAVGPAVPGVLAVAHVLGDVPHTVLQVGAVPRVEARALCTGGGGGAAARPCVAGGAGALCGGGGRVQEGEADATIDTL